MKFAPLLAQYLYTHKRLDLPGIGTFILDPTTILEPDHSKKNKPTVLEGVTFENNESVMQSVDLVDFISQKSGKIKPLAAADLDSHLELAKQFLNIGKPFMFEGIGSLSKLQVGGFFFSPGELIPERVKDVSTKTIAGNSVEEPATDYRTVFYAKKNPLNWRKPAILILLLAGMVVAVWGGYLMYKKKLQQKSNMSGGNPIEEQKVMVTDTMETIINKDTANFTATSAGNKMIADTGIYKFVLETSSATRAFARYKSLVAYKWPVQLETKDSVTYNIFIQSPAADTTRFIDSLSRLNGKRVYVAQ